MSMLDHLESDLFVLFETSLGDETWTHVFEQLRDQLNFRLTDHLWDGLDEEFK